MITELLLQQFKAHSATRLPLGRLTVLVGPNSVGKTSVLEGLLLLSRLLDHPAAEVFTGKNDLRWLVRSGATEEMKIRVAGTLDTSEWFCQVRLPLGGDIHKVVLDRTVPVSEQAPDGTRALRGAVSLRLEARRLAEPSYSEEEVPKLESDGYGLATMLSTLKLAPSDQFLKLEELACKIVPRLKRIGFKRTKVEQLAPRVVKLDKQSVLMQETRAVVADELVLDYEDIRGLPAHAASEGTLLVLGILCAIFSPTRPSLLLLDDVDRALHTQAQKELLAGIHHTLEISPDLQIVATTHSPYLVDALEPDEVVFLARGQDGTVAAKRMSDHPKAAMLDVLTTGELWTAEGESWAAQP